VAVVILVALGSAAAALPFGDASEGWNFRLAPVAAGVAVALLMRRSGQKRMTVLGCAAAVLTVLFMFATLFVLIAVWGI
jgi:hypothetical protein